MSWHKHSIAFREDIRVSDRFSIRRRPAGGGGGDEGRGGGSGGGAPPIKVFSNVYLKAKDKGGKVVEERDSHNIFLDYGRDWIAHLVGIDTGSYFRTDRIAYMAFGIGGTAQMVSASTIRDPLVYNYPGYPNDWVGGVGSGNPQQTDVDPSVIGLEWPVQVTLGDYFNLISQPNTFPGTVGVIRFTSVLGLNEVSFGAFASVPLSEIGLFTEGYPTALDTTSPPTTAVTPAEKFMVAYNTFDTLSKTNLFYLEVDWELRFS